MSPEAPQAVQKSLYSDMDYIAVIDHDHLDNGIFLTALARAISGHNSERGLIIHGDSAYTDRLIQTGMFRSDAQIRATKDLNHRLVALFADHGVAMVGLNGYQRSLIQRDGDQLKIDTAHFRRLPGRTQLLISNLAADSEESNPVPVPLPWLAEVLAAELEIPEIYVFSADDSEEFINRDRPERLTRNQMDPSFIRKYIPKEFQEIPIPFRLTTARDFSRFPSLEGSTVIG